MEYLKIRTYMRPVILKELFDAGDIAENKEIYYKSTKTGVIEGPYFLNSNKSIVELFVEVELGMIYVLDTQQINELSIAFKLKLKCAEIEDLKPNGILKTRASYYILNNEKLIQGPFFLSENTSRMQLNKDFKNQAIYTPINVKNIEQLTRTKTA